MKNYFTIPLLAVIAVSAYTANAFAVHNEKEIREVFSQLGDAMDELDLEAASKLMTKNALDEVCADTLLMCIQISSEDIGMPEITDQLSEIVDEYGLDEIELPKSLTDLESEEFPSEEEMENVRKEILKAVPDGKRLEIVTDIKKVTEEFMFGDNPFAGEIEEVKINDDVATITVELEEFAEMMEDAELDGEIELEMMPIVLKFKKVDDAWKWDGFDIEKTNALMDDVAPLSSESIDRDKKDEK